MAGPLSIPALIPVAIAGAVRMIAPKLLRSAVGKGKSIPSGGIKRVSNAALPKNTLQLQDVIKNPITTENRLVQVYRRQIKNMAKNQQNPDVPGTYFMGRPGIGRSYQSGSSDKKLPLPKKRGGPVGYSQRWKTGRKG